MKSWLVLTMAIALAGCGSSPPPAPPVATTSSTIAITSDDHFLWVVAPDADSVSVIDLTTLTLADEILLAPAPPAPDPTTMRYEPSVKPRALAILPGDKKVYVAGQTAGMVYVIDAATHAVTSTIAVAPDPVGVVASPDGSAVYVVSHEAALISKIDPAMDQVTATLPVTEHPWGASVSADGSSLFISHLLLHAGVTTIDTASFMVSSTLELADQPPDSNGKLVPNGVARGVYQAVPRPVTGELWLPHMLLAIKTPEPMLDFQSTAFPTISTLAPDGASDARRLLFKPLTVPGATGAFDDSISGPRAVAFTPDGSLALMTNSGSEDVMVFDAQGGKEVALVRPLPAAFLEGIVVDHGGLHAYVNGRNTHNVVMLDLPKPGLPGPQNITVDGDPIDLLNADPMPSQLRQGQHLFYTANTSELPITQNFWISCSTCHLEGGTDAVTWLFLEGPRDTPSNAGGPINTGFLMRQPLRNSVIDYDITINREQGGNFSRNNATQLPLLEALAAFVNYAIPFPQNPNRSSDGTLTASQMRGQATFAANCATCHTGAYFTDSGAGNPTLDMTGASPIVLHDVGTCVQNGPFDDQPLADDVIGTVRAACQFDTPTLRGIFATPPYFHDGSADTLDDVVNRLQFSSSLSDAAKSDLVDYLKTL